MYRVLLSTEEEKNWKVVINKSLIVSFSQNKSLMPSLTFFLPCSIHTFTTATPVLSPQELKQMGYTMAAYPLTLLSASIKAMTESLDRIQQGLPTDDIISTFSETKDVVGFTKYASEEQRYKSD